MQRRSPGRAWSMSSARAGRSKRFPEMMSVKTATAQRRQEFGTAPPSARPPPPSPGSRSVAASCSRRSGWPLGRSRRPARGGSPPVFSSASGRATPSCSPSWAACWRPRRWPRASCRRGARRGPIRSRRCEPTERLPRRRPPRRRTRGRATSASRRASSPTWPSPAPATAPSSRSRPGAAPAGPFGRTQPRSPQPVAEALRMMAPTARHEALLLVARHARRGQAAAAAKPSRGGEGPAARSRAAGGGSGAGRPCVRMNQPRTWRSRSAFGPRSRAVSHHPGRPCNNTNIA